MFESKHPFCVQVVPPPHVLCIKCTFPASASWVVNDINTTQSKKRSIKRINELKPVDLF